MKYFDYAEPATLQEAVGLLHAGGTQASLMAGGTDLLVQMKEHVRSPARVINIKKIPGIDDFGFDPRSGLTLGALVTVRQVETSPVTLRHYASLAKASTDFASIQVRNRATVVGNVCRASPSADTLPPLIADGAMLRIEGPAGRRECRIEDFCTGPGRTALGAGEIATHIRIPAPPPGTGKVYIKHGRRAQMELATVGVAGHVDAAGRHAAPKSPSCWPRCAPTPLRARRADAVLREQPLTTEIRRRPPLPAASERQQRHHRRRARQRRLPARDGACAQPPRDRTSRGGAGMKSIVTFTVNGEEREIAVEPNRSLLDALRTDAGLTGTKKGCDVGECGSCTVMMNGKPVNACLVSLAMDSARCAK